jgi:hypothetical protein
MTRDEITVVALVWLVLALAAWSLFTGDHAPIEIRGGCF